MTNLVENIVESEKRSWFSNTFLNTIDKMLPTSFFLKDFKSLPTTSLYITALLFNLAYAVAFLNFIITSYDSGVSDSYISLDPESGDCSEVPSTTTGTFKIDMSGNWETSVKYDASRALYGTDFLAYAHTNEEYSLVMNNSNAYLFNKTGEKGSHRDLAWNLIALSSFTVKTKQNGSLEMYPTGELMSMLNQDYYVSSIFLNANGDGSNLQYPCTGSLVSGHETGAYLNIDTATSKFKAGYSIDIYTADDCRKLADQFGYNPDYDGDTFELSLDINSFSTAVAVNYGILNSSFLVMIKDYPEKGYSDDDYSYYYDDGNATSASESNRAQAKDQQANRVGAKSEINRALYGVKDKHMKKEKDSSARKLNEKSVKAREAHRQLTGDSYEFLYFFDAKYDMKPVACVEFNKNKEDLQCFIYYASGIGTFGFPVIKHFGNNATMTDCSNTMTWGPNWYNSDPTSNGNWLDTYDHTIDILMGLIFFTDINDALSYAIDARAALKASIDGDLTIPNKLFPNLRAAVDVAFFYGPGGTYSSYSSTDVCGIDPLTGLARFCFPWTFNVYGSSFYTNPQNTQLFAGACRNSLYVDEAFKLVTSTPPTPLVQTYFSCTLKPYESFFNALGLSLGNADIYARASFFMFMLIFISYRLLTRTIDPEILSSGHYESPKQAEAVKSNDSSDAKSPLHNNL